MEPIMNKKREVATLLPYRWRGNVLELFIQKRCPDVTSAPNKLGLFGGGLEEGEGLLEALRREIQEELEYVPKAPRYFSRYEHATHINNVFIEEVGSDFENIVHVHEGEYGKFMTFDEFRSSDDAMSTTMGMIDQASRFILSQK